MTSDMRSIEHLRPGERKPLSPEAKRKLSMAVRQHWTPEQRQIASLMGKERMADPGVRARISVGMKLAESMEDIDFTRPITFATGQLHLSFEPREFGAEDVRIGQVRVARIYDSLPQSDFAPYYVLMLNGFNKNKVRVRSRARARAEIYQKLVVWLDNLGFHCVVTS